MFIRKYLSAIFRDFPHLDQAVIEIENLQELKKIFGFSKDPVLKDTSIYNFEFPEDLNERRVRDAETLGVIARNISPQICVDIGTAVGHSAALLAQNAPQAQVHTVNISPDEALKGLGGQKITEAYSIDQIGSYYKKLKLKNIHQIIANTAAWQPKFKSVDLAFIDGCHDTDFVFNDSLKILSLLKPGGFMLWHDFNPSLSKQYDWIYSVCAGVERLLVKKLISGHIYLVKNSWVGIYQRLTII